MTVSIAHLSATRNRRSKQAGLSNFISDPSVFAAEDNASFLQVSEGGFSFFEKKITQGLQEWEENKLWFLRTMLEQRNHSHFQCYVSHRHQFKVCTSPKVSSSVWKKVFCRLNRGSSQRCHLATKYWYASGESRFNTKVDLSKATIVRVIRDPLERLFSAFYDKCVHETHRLYQRHCHPLQLMTKLPNEYFRTPRAFHQWVDTLGFEWDEHVLPQCVEAYFPKGSVPYSPQPYTHVIEMDSAYLESLRVMLSSVKLLSAEDRVWILDQFRKGFSARPQQNETIELYKKYFSRASVARALQYYAADYRCLNLSLPLWLSYVQV